ncbi:sensor histidine kinase [Lacrimispora xylanisolvens]|uniref:sensor histidine kinase n=1 Tax=Lacrimispora xylanisolvens TaxID=384636 RepID=UPI00240293EE
MIDTYNYMTRAMNQLIAEQNKAAEDLRLAEFHSLQAQINPHFLYNTMDMINWLAKQGRTDEVSEAIVDLSRFYKLTLRRKETLSTIADELEHANIYVRLQNMRYHQVIDLVNDMPDYMMDCTIPKLTFQPVVENAILHGLLEKVPKGGTIVITGWLEENAAVILISDDGVGIPEDKLSGLLSGKGTSKTGTNIAVFNTHRRLQILYGPEYGLTYHSVPGKGTEVELRVRAAGIP